MRKSYNKKVINYNEFEFHLETQDTSYGFRHLGTLYFKDSKAKEKLEVTSKCTYYNRTWESYDYQSLIRKLFDKFIKTYDKTYKFKWEKSKFNLNDLMSEFESRNEDRQQELYKTILKFSKIGEILTDTQKERNDWTKRMIAAGVPGIEFPEDWDTLSEDEKEKRLKYVLELAKGEIK